MLLEPAPRTVRGARDLLSVGLQYGNAFGQGFQAAALKPADFFGNDDVLYLMEDMATGEIRLSILWEWLHKGAAFTEDDAETGVEAGDTFTADLFARLLAEEYEKLLAASNRDVHDDSKKTTLPIAREIVERYVTSDVKAPVVHRSAEHQSRQPRPARPPSGASAATWRSCSRDGTRITENLDFVASSGGTTTVGVQDETRFEEATRSSRQLVRSPRFDGIVRLYSPPAGRRTAGHDPDRLLSRRARRPRVSTTRLRELFEEQRSDHDLRPLLPRPGGDHEASRHRGHLPRRLGDLGQGLDHRGSWCRSGELSAEPGARRGGPDRPSAADGRQESTLRPLANDRGRAPGHAGGRLPPLHHRRRRYRPRWRCPRSQPDSPVRRGGRPRLPHRRPEARRQEVRSPRRQGPGPGGRADQAAQRGTVPARRDEGCRHHRRPNRCGVGDLPREHGRTSAISPSFSAPPTSICRATRLGTSRSCGSSSSSAWRRSGGICSSRSRTRRTRRPKPGSGRPDCCARSRRA